MPYFPYSSAKYYNTDTSNPDFTGEITCDSLTATGNVSGANITDITNDINVLQTDVNDKADINNPTFTGTVNASDILKVGDEATLEGTMIITNDHGVKTVGTPNTIDTVFNDTNGDNIIDCIGQTEFKCPVQITNTTNANGPTQFNFNNTGNNYISGNTSFLDGAITANEINVSNGTTDTVSLVGSNGSITSTSLTTDEIVVNTDIDVKDNGVSRAYISNTGTISLTDGATNTGTSKVILESGGNLKLSNTDQNVNANVRINGDGNLYITDTNTTEAKIKLSGASGISVTDTPGNSKVSLSTNGTIITVGSINSGSSVSAPQYRMVDNNDPTGTAPDSLIYRSGNTFELVSSDKIPLRLWCGNWGSGQHIIMYPQQQIDGSTYEAGNTLYAANNHKFNGNMSSTGSITATGNVNGANITTINNTLNTKAPINDPTFTGTINGFYLNTTGDVTFNNPGGLFPTHFNYNTTGTNYIRGNTEFGNGFKGEAWYSNTSPFPLGSGTWTRLAWINNGSNIYYQGSNPAFDGPLSTPTGFPSDQRIKKNISTLEVEALDLLDKLTVKEYDIGFPAEKDMNNPNLMDGVFTRREIGLIAQDVLAIPEFSDFVTDPQNNCDFYKLRYNNFFTLSLKAIQELNVKCRNLQTENTQLRTDLDALTARVVALETN